MDLDATLAAHTRQIAELNEALTGVSPADAKASPEIFGELQQRLDALEGKAEEARTQLQTRLDQFQARIINLEEKLAVKPEPAAEHAARTHPTGRTTR